MNIEPISVEYIDHMGSDARVANVARVSFNKWKDENEFDSKDAALLAYLATGLPSAERNDWYARANASTHWSPFAHCYLSVRSAVPIFLARQLVKHQVGLSWNEESRRYIKEPVSIWLPDQVLEAPAHAKQGAAGVHPCTNDMRELMLYQATQSVDAYENLLHAGVAPEEARMILPQNAVTHYVWSGSLMAFIRVVKQRKDLHAQTAAREYAGLLEGVLRQHFPETCKVFLDE